MKRKAASAAIWETIGSTVLALGVVLTLFLPAPSRLRADEANPVPANTREAPAGIATYVEEPSAKWPSDFVLSGAGPRIYTEPSGDGLAYWAEVRGTYVASDAALIWKSDALDLTAGGDFMIRIPIVAQATRLEFFGVGPTGDLKPIVLGIWIEKWDTFRQTSLKEPPKNHFFNIGVGLSSIEVRDSRFPDFSEFGLTAKVSYARMILPPHWDSAASAFFTALPFGANRADVVRFLGLNFRVGYILPGIREPWRISLQAGVYYTTMFVSSNSFGFSNLAGPQFFPTIRRQFRDRSTLGGYLKYSPVSSWFSLTALSNHEIAGGIFYSRPTSAGRSWSVSLDLSRLAFTLSAVDTLATTATLGVSLGF